MFLRPEKRCKDGKEHPDHALVESERTPDGPRRRRVAYLGELNRDQDHLARQAGLLTLIHKPPERRYGQAVPNPRPMTPTVILRELARIQIGDIILQTTDGRELMLRRVARPNAEQKRILAALKMELPERLRPDRLL